LDDVPAGTATREATKSQIEQAMHVLAKAELIGTYQKGDR
jgi:hypothetical protein